MTISAAEKAVVIARRRKKRALPGSKQERLFDLKRAVTEALIAARSAQSAPPQIVRGPVR